MADADYLHGYDEAEQARLIEQAAFWRDSLIPLGLDYAGGDGVLEIGCGVGAVLYELVRRFPGIRIAGIDLVERQVDAAREHLAGHDADLRVGDGGQLPWAAGAFDHVYMMWIIEHLNDARPVLAEALRVLRTGGSIALTETDYTTFRVEPTSDDIEYLFAAQHDHFARHGNPVVGRQLGNLLVEAGFAEVENRVAGFHTFPRDGDDSFQKHVDYVTGFMEPAIPTLAKALERDRPRMERGLADFRAAASHPHGSLSHTVYRALARKR